MIKITLNIEGKKKTFSTSKVNAFTMRKMLQFYKKMEDKNENDLGISEQLDVMDEMVQIVADVFPNPEVNFDNIWKGLDIDELMPTLEDVFKQINETGNSEKK